MDPVERRWLAAAAGGGGVFLVMLAALLSGATGPLDADHSGRLVFESRVVNALGTTLVVGAAALAAAGYLAARRRWWHALRVVAVPLVVALAATLVKEIVARPRPSYALVEAAGYSFPSGHASAGAALAVLVAWYASTLRASRRVVLLLVGAGAAWALAQALGRLLLGVHYVSDVVAGLGLGVCVGAGVIAATLAAERRWSRAR